jgi:putative transposase
MSINRTYRRSGTLWEDRFRSCLTQEEDYVLACYRYIELNPVRAKMVEHPLYTALSKDEKARQAVYRELFRYQLDHGMIDAIRVATNSNDALGSPRFQAQVAVALGRRVTPGESGRPRKRKQLDPRDLFGKE